jgi:membrane protein
MRRPARVAAAVRRVGDRLARLPGVATALDVQRRYTDIRGSALAAAITLYLFLAIFAVTVLAVAVLGFLSAGGVHLARDLPNQLGVTGSAARLVRRAVNTAERSRATATVVGVLGLAWTGTSLAVAIGDTYDAAWDVESRALAKRARGLVWLVGAAVALGAGGFVTAGWSVLPVFFGPLVVIVAVAADTVLFVWTAWILPRRRAPLRAVLPAAVLGGVALEVLKLVGAYALPHLVERSSELYGTIGTVFALLVWLLVVGRIIVSVAVIEARDAEQRARRPSGR